ncbi:hypothetical protein KSD_78450 [Ktedonobacter sp. SOSP1-85]|nr:hypothetical protein KSD_78450 [Ktedonobacter sp. SOSP1-85]
MTIFQSPCQLYGTSYLFAKNADRPITKYWLFTIISRAQAEKRGSRGTSSSAIRHIQ